MDATRMLIFVIIGSGLVLTIGLLAVLARLIGRDETCRSRRGRKRHAHTVQEEIFNFHI